MLNKIWFWLLVIGLGYGFGKAAYLQYTGKEAASTEVAAGNESDLDDTPKVVYSPLHAAGKRLSDATLNSATVAVEICIALIGVMALWLGMLAIAREAGLVDALARALRPLMRWLFPDVPDGHPAQGSMLMNISANMLGMGNAATPLGLKAMRELQTLNPTKETATNAMATFMAINTSSVTLVPMTIIALRAANKSASPASPLAGIILTTAVSTIVAITVVRLLSTSRDSRCPNQISLAPAIRIANRVCQPTQTRPRRTDRGCLSRDHGYVQSMDHPPGSADHRPNGVLQTDPHVRDICHWGQRRV